MSPGLSRALLLVCCARSNDGTERLKLSWSEYDFTNHLHGNSKKHIGCLGAITIDGVPVVPVSERQNVTVMTKDELSAVVPLGVVEMRWDAALILQWIAMILFEEVLGYNTDITDFVVTSIFASYLLADCATPKGEDKGCEPESKLAVPRRHIALESWRQDRVGVLNLGSVGYSGMESFHLLPRELAAAYDATGMAIEYYKAWNASWKNHSNNFVPFFAALDSISREELMPLKETQFFTNTLVMDSYRLFTDDIAGVLEIDERLLPQVYKETWFLSPACRHAPQLCVPFISGGDGWGLDAQIQKSAVYRMPFAHAVARNWSMYVDLPRRHSLGVYTWMPDVTFVDLSPQVLIYPTHDPEAWAENDMRTASSSITLSKLVHVQLPVVANTAYRLLTAFSLRLMEMEVMLAISKANQTPPYQLACQWLHENQQRWMPWIPDPTDCPVGQGLVGIQGIYESSRQGKLGLKCKVCPAGRSSEIIEDVHRGLKSTTRICATCNPGKFQAMPAMTRCKGCQAGRHARSIGLSSCEYCPRGQFQPNSDATDCDSCPFGQGTAMTGGTSVEQCSLQHLLWLLSCVVGGAGFASFLLMYGRFRGSQIRARRDNMLACVRAVGQLEFPLQVMSARSFKDLGCMIRFERAHQRNLLKAFYSIDHVRKFLRSELNLMVFVSHQWLQWDVPDRDCTQYRAICFAADAIAAKFLRRDDCLYIWLDYHSIPQRDSKMQLQAIHSLPIYATLVSLFCIVAPTCEHGDSAVMCDARSYLGRMWCRTELFSHYSSCGNKNMYLLQTMKHDSDQYVLEKPTDSWIQEGLLIFEGDCTCCARGHINTSVCDKEFVRDMVLGLYANVLLRNKIEDAGIESSHSSSLTFSMTDDVCLAIRSKKQRMFPKRFTMSLAPGRHVSRFLVVLRQSMSRIVRMDSQRSSGSGIHMIKVTRPLFGQYIEELEDYIARGDQVLLQLFEERGVHKANEDSDNEDWDSEDGDDNGSSYDENIVL